MVAYGLEALAQVVADTDLTAGVAGFELQNGTPNILTWTAPADGKSHLVIVVVSNENQGAAAAVGGAIGWTATNPGGGTTAAVQLLAGNPAAGGSHHQIDAAIVGSGTTVTIAQNSALTNGEPVFCWAKILAL